MFVTLAGYVDRRVCRLAEARYADVLGPADREEITGDVLYQLMSGTLAAFRGETMGELFAYVRQVADRSLSRHARRRIRERNTLSGDAGEQVRAWAAQPPGPEQAVRIVPENPLADADTEYLTQLMAAGSKAEHARRVGTSRAAVTQRVARIRARIAAMAPSEQARAQAWIRHTAATFAEAHAEVE